MAKAATQLAKYRAKRDFTRTKEPSGSRNVLAAFVAVLIAASSVLAQTPAIERPAVGPERPFQLAPRVERTLANGLRVIVARQAAVPKVSIVLTVLSGYSSDPANLTGLAAVPWATGSYARCLLHAQPTAVWRAGATPLCWPCCTGAGYAAASLWAWRVE